MERAWATSSGSSASGSSRSHSPRSVPVLMLTVSRTAAHAHARPPAPLHPPAGVRGALAACGHEPFWHRTQGARFSFPRSGTAPCQFDRLLDLNTKLAPAALTHSRSSDLPIESFGRACGPHVPTSWRRGRKCSIRWPAMIPTVMLVRAVARPGRGLGRRGWLVHAGPRSRRLRRVEGLGASREARRPARRHTEQLVGNAVSHRLTTTSACRLIGHLGHRAFVSTVRRRRDASRRRPEADSGEWLCRCRDVISELRQRDRDSPSYPQPTSSATVDGRSCSRAWTMSASHSGLV